MTFYILKYFIAPIIRLCLIKKIKNLDCLPKPPCIITPNHTSLFDALVIPSILIKKYDEAHIWIRDDFFTFRGGKILERFLKKHYGCFAVKAEGIKHRGARALKKSEKILGQEGVIVIFPEGERSTTGRLQKGHTGAARLAIKYNIPVVPVAIKGAFKLLPPKTVFPRFWNGRVSVAFGKPLKHKKTKYSYQKAKMFTKQIMNEIARLKR